MDIWNLYKFYKIILIVLHVLIFAAIGFFCSQYIYLLAHQQREPWKDSLMTAGEVVREKGLMMRIEISPPVKVKK